MYSLLHNKNLLFFTYKFIFNHNRKEQKKFKFVQFDSETNHIPIYQEEHTFKVEKMSMRNDETNS